MPEESKHVFHSYRRIAEDDMRTLWNECVFVLDANVLLNFYRYTPEHLANWFEIFEQISQRIWIPFHAALEFYDNRINVMLDQAGQFGKVTSIVEKYKEQIETDIKKLNLEERHSKINPQQFLSEIAQATDGFLSEIARLKQEYEISLLDDPLILRIEKLFDGRLGPIPDSQSTLDDIFEKGRQRYKIGMPPGFMDQKEKEGKFLVFHGLVYKKEFGDYVFWREILDFSRERRVRYVVLITDDKKQDWWWIENNRTQGPRRELVEEIRRVSGVDLFHMYTPDRFLTYASQYLGVDVEESSIRQAQYVSAVKKHVRRAIPEFSREDILAALHGFDNDLRILPEWSDFPWSYRGHHKYAIRHQGRFYPVKTIISMASGVPRDDFSGGEQANGRVLRLGFDIVRISDLAEEDEDSFLAEDNGNHLSDNDHS